MALSPPGNDMCIDTQVGQQPHKRLRNPGGERLPSTAQHHHAGSDLAQTIQRQRDVRSHDREVAIALRAARESLGQNVVPENCLAF